MFDWLNETIVLHNIITVGSFIILGIGISGALLKKNLFKIFLSLSIAEASLFIFFIGMHFEIGKEAPIAYEAQQNLFANMVDPVPQAMILTTIVIAIAVLALALSFINQYYKLSKNLNVDQMNEFKEEE